jgi:histidinol-phosphate aminotransferase
MVVVQQEIPVSLVPENVARLTPYAAGKPIEEVEKELGLTNVLKLASNESPLGPSPKALAAIAEIAPKIAVYPDGLAPVLRAPVAQHLQIPEDHLVFGNGSDELLHLICETFIQPGVSGTVQADPSFAMYQIYATLAGAKITKVPLIDYTHDLDGIADAITLDTKIVFIANPNNPTGTFLTHKTVQRYLDRVPDHVITVFDEAYDEFVESQEKPDLLPIIREGRNIIVCRTFSKAYALAGLRVGYAIARPEITDYLNRGRSPFNVNMLAQHAAAAALADTEHLKKTVALNSAGKRQLYDALDQRGLPYVPTEANFVLIDVSRDSRDVFDALLRLGVIIRAGYGLGLPYHIRVSIGTHEQNARFLSALDRVLGSQGVSE